MDDKDKKMEKVKNRSVRGLAAEGEDESLKRGRKNEKRMRRTTLRKAVLRIRRKRDRGVRG